MRTATTTSASGDHRPRRGRRDGCPRPASGPLRRCRRLRFRRRHRRAPAPATANVERTVRRRRSRGRRTRQLGAAAGVAAPPRRDSQRRPGRGGRSWPDPRAVARAARCRHDARRDDRRTHGHAVRARARARREGRPGDVVATRHRLRDGGHRRAHPRPDPGQVGDRCRGAQPHPTARLPRRPAPRPGGSRGDRPARRRHRQGHRRRRRVPRPRHDPAPAHRRGDGRGQVELHQQHPRLAADAADTRPGAPDPRRPQAGRDGPVQPAAAPAHAAGDEPEEGGQRPRLGGQGDGAALRPAVGEGLPRHHRLQRGVRPGPTRARPGERARSPSVCPTSSSWSTSSTT